MNTYSIIRIKNIPYIVQHNLTQEQFQELYHKILYKTHTRSTSFITDINNDTIFSEEYYETVTGHKLDTKDMVEYILDLMKQDNSSLEYNCLPCNETENRLNVTRFDTLYYIGDLLDILDDNEDNAVKSTECKMFYSFQNPYSPFIVWIDTKIKGNDYIYDFFNYMINPSHYRIDRWQTKITNSINNKCFFFIKDECINLIRELKKDTHLMEHLKEIKENNKNLNKY